MTLQTSKPSPLLAAALRAMEGNIPDIVRGHTPDNHICQITLQMYVGDEFWLSLPLGQRRSLGRQFKQLVLRGDQPVEWIGRTANRLMLYRLKPSAYLHQPSSYQSGAPAIEQPQNAEELAHES
jgi:hypothetical protein